MAADQLTDQHVFQNSSNQMATSHRVCWRDQSVFLVSFRNEILMITVSTNQEASCKSHGHKVSNQDAELGPFGFTSDCALFVCFADFVIFSSSA